MSRLPLLAAVAAALALVGGCGGSGGSTKSSGPAAAPAQTASVGAATVGASTGSPGALQAEANATVAGDIPDNQIFLTFRNSSAGYSIKYPEGWAQQGRGGHVTFRDKNNIVRVVVAAGPAPTKAGVQAEVAGLQGATAQGAVQALTISGRPALKVVYSSESAPNSVTGKRVKLVVDRYYLWQGGRHAVVDLGTPQGVDNVDAYRMMIESFRWS
jgi:hypothetical protein